MTISEPSQMGEPPHHTYKQLRSDGVHVVLSPGAQRLFWSLDGAFPAAISVMDTANSPESLRSFLQQDVVNNDIDGDTWHEIWHVPLIEPKISSVEVSVYDLEHWEEAWMTWHRGHDEKYAEYVTYGELSDEDRPYPAEMREEGGWESDSDTDFLVKCCGEDRPLRKAVKLVVTHSTANDHVTIHDYLSVVHPWLMSLREDILRAKRVALGYPVTMPTEWMINCSPGSIMIEDKEKRMQQLRGHPRSHNVPASILDRLRRNR